MADLTHNKRNGRRLNEHIMEQQCKMNLKKKRQRQNWEDLIYFAYRYLLLAQHKECDETTF